MIEAVGTWCLLTFMVTGTAFFVFLVVAIVVLMVRL